MGIVEVKSPAVNTSSARDSFTSRRHKRKSVKVHKVHTILPSNRYPL